ncbi:MAG: single-stranded-DNA-specific exonuclease RecJ [Waddliaceae bacterium]|jgi:single-stranded-DNA-specific exonuclease|nr:single-stranded-DNA-specific exonuclease RecJ [Waddliaceae bacterium]MBT3578567.1 single-stranded-DNA-specific exonuclease RecJ [Waddliaceae bacterium]MBT4444712.1 single-stranded-DNA-specific exonuclease RecJ [Waddliaceae bacterium]MBT6928689.1 single-stranded-DNA-specific exonuclease RecJ [Waddliaceae bacterium]MBT7264921.1 single-stranded-DNA-specific exonuclease RecJ [Waddliaceae bacterium]
MSPREFENLWIYPTINSEWTEAITKEFRLHPVIAQVLTSRKFSSLEDIHGYLYSKLPDLHDPTIFADMGKAVKRVCKAIVEKENILIYGDNDVDGMTGTALLTEFLSYLGANVFFFVPDSDAIRQEMIVNALGYALRTECSLMITVDCGITAAASIDTIAEHNIDVIITDHHEPTNKIPNCVATLNPKLLNSKYPNKELTGVGVAFKLAHGVTNSLVAAGAIGKRRVDLKQYLDLVALGTISDMGALIGENRILVRYGIKQINKGIRVGLTKLFEVCGLNITETSSNDIASKVTPRLNSLGRIADPRKGVELLLMRENTPDAEAHNMALDFDVLNTERQKIERLVQEEAEAMLLGDPKIFDDKAIVLYSKNWHPGVIAISTTRITKQYNRPTVMITVKNGIGKGSIRSIQEFPLLDALKESSDLLLSFGGHNYAAGITIKEENIAKFKKNFLVAANKVLKDHDVTSKLHIDAPITFKDLTFDFMDSLSLLSPYGNGNPQPILYCDAKQVWFPKVISKKHLKFYLSQDDRTLEGIAFGMADRAESLRKKGLLLRIAFTPQINTFHNKSSIQLLIRDFKILNE